MIWRFHLTWRRATRKRAEFCAFRATETAAALTQPPDGSGGPSYKAVFRASPSSVSQASHSRTGKHRQSKRAADPLRFLGAAISSFADLHIHARSNSKPAGWPVRAPFWRGVPSGEAGWVLEIGADRNPQPLALSGGAISSSGTAVRGNHVVDPRRGSPAARYRRVWATAQTAAPADALSTAFLLMPEPAIRKYCDRHPQVSAWLLDRPDGDLRRIAADGGAGETD